MGWLEWLHHNGPRNAEAKVCQGNIAQMHEVCINSVTFFLLSIKKLCHHCIISGLFVFSHAVLLISVWLIGSGDNILMIDGLSAIFKFDVPMVNCQHKGPHHTNSHLASVLLYDQLWDFWKLKILLFTN